ncbi:MAG: hypothetical protein OQK82_06790 [Candidatus Pacearchaeota archaeon]|nr:hypothetical protein [Candidatus Pacearchaeota archaeon]
MIVELQSQVKGIISSVLTIIIAVSAGFVSENSLLWIVIILCGLIQISLICIPSVEEKFYKKKMAHMERQDELDMDFKEKSKEFKLSKDLEKMQKTAKKIKSEDVMKNYINLLNHIRERKK